MQKRLHAFFEGRVQGVGFRFTARALAQAAGVVGWAKNLNNGRVEILAEGSEEDLQRFQSLIEDQFRRYICDTQIQWEDPTGEFDDFGIRL